MTTTIGTSTRIDGRIEGDADLVVEGRVDGTIVLSEALTVAEGGYVTGNVDVRIAIIEGAVSGTVKASELVHLTKTAQVAADIYAANLRMDAGATVSGRVEMDVNAAPAPRRASTAPRPAPAAKPAAKPAATPAPAPTPEPPPSNESEPTSARQPAQRPRGGDSIDELSIKELRERLKDLDLPVSGTKSELVERLRENS